MIGLPLPRKRRRVRARRASVPDAKPDWRGGLLTRFSWTLGLGAAPLVIYSLATLNAPTSTQVAFWTLLCASAASALARHLDFRARGLTLVMVLPTAVNSRWTLNGWNVLV